MKIEARKRRAFYPRVLTEVEQTALLQAAADPRFKVFIRLSIETAGRIHELIGLPWRCISLVDLDRASVLFPGTLRHQTRQVPIGRSLAQELQVIRQRSTDPGPFTFWTASHVNKRFDKARRVAGLEDVRIADLARTAVWRWSKSKRSHKAVAATAGMTAETIRAYRSVRKGGVRC